MSNDLRHSNVIRIFVYRKTTDNQFIILYLRMKKEFGKWLMDIAKYMATALLLSSTFGDMKNPLVVVSVIVATALTLIFGLLLIRDKKEKEEV